MKNYVCRTVTELPGYMQAQVRVQDNTTIHAGEIYVADTLDNGLHYGNFTYYIPEIISDVETQDPVIVLDGSFEVLEDGRRPKGQPDYTQYIYQPDEILTAIRIDTNIKLELGLDCISNPEEVVAGGYLIPVNSSTELEFVTSLTDQSVKVYFVVEAIKYFRLGGQFGSDFTTTAIVRAKKTDIVGDPAITSVTATVEEGLQVGNENVASGATVATLATVGGTEPYTYALNEDSVNGADNASFVISNNLIQVGTNALTEAKNYLVSFKVTDSVGKEKTGNAIIPVEAAPAPEITNVAVVPNGTVTVPASVGTIVAGVTVTGGTEPYVYSLPAGTQDNDLMTIDGNEVKVGQQLTELRNYNIRVNVTDANQKTGFGTATIHTDSAAITDITADITSDLQEGNANVASGATIATLTAVGGNAPYTYSLSETGSNADNGSFTIDGNLLKVGSTALTMKTYNVAVEATDTYGKTFSKDLSIVVGTLPITALNVQVVEGLQEGNENVAAGATVASMSTTGGVAPYTYSFNEDPTDGANNSSFVISDANLNVGDTALTTGNYLVSLKVTDKNGTTSTANSTIAVAEAST